jgi:hypothetical protein
MRHPADGGEQFRLLCKAFGCQECGSAIACRERTEPSPVARDPTVVAEKEHSVCNHECLRNIVGDQERCGAADQLGELIAKTVARRRIECGERLIEQEQPRLTNERARKRHPLPLAS